MVLYDLVEELLTMNEELRNSDKKLVWEVWKRLGFIHGGVLSENQFMRDDLPPIESITRARRKAQELKPALRASAPVEQARRRIAEDKGTTVFREKVNAQPKGHYEYRGGSAVWVEDSV